MRRICLSITTILVVSCSNYTLPSETIVSVDTMIGTLDRQDCMTLYSPTFKYNVTDDRLYVLSTSMPDVISIDDESAYLVKATARCFAENVSFSDSAAFFQLKGMEDSIILYSRYDWHIPVNDDRIPEWFDNYEFSTDQGFIKSYGVIVPERKYFSALLNQSEKRIRRSGVPLQTDPLSFKEKLQVLRALAFSLFIPNPVGRNYYMDIDSMAIFRPESSNHLFAVSRGLVHKCKEYALYQLGYNCTSVQIMSDTTILSNSLVISRSECGTLYSFNNGQTTHLKIHAVRDSLCYRIVGTLGISEPEELINLSYHFPDSLANILFNTHL